MITEKSTIRTEAIFSEDKTQRYIYKKTWNKNQPIVTVISISPSDRYNISSDLTTMLITNNVAELNYGGFELVNLISKVGVNAKKLKSLSDCYDEDTDKYIKDSVSSTELTILAWGKISETNKHFIERENEVMQLISDYSDKLYSIADMSGREGLHPLTPSVRGAWLLQKMKKQE